MEEADFTVQTIPVFLSLSFHILNKKKIVLDKFQIRYNNWAFFHWVFSLFWTINQLIFNAETNDIFSPNLTSFFLSTILD